ncbi:DUF493 family protein [Alcaligenes endophyticus]|uniref:UPF0250 protein LMS43_00030 n=1 Tax=Alcaligenes endophyticus TaxID=1929088 RepID=A0ABT8EEI1_9BURK|nr:DUF493 family protein [Alcaligenes endophyticus]MCX5592223.1 DUF493 family protein [Alcaligenes endophyticus]MDN4119665.1 DUF493 family protein [Alcaligenes endophyticus]
MSIPPEESLIEYPCHFPIKVMGVAHENLVSELTEIVLGFDSTFDDSTIEHRPSKQGNYLGLTYRVWVTSREQLDDLYRTLHAHHLVRVVL